MLKSGFARLKPEAASNRVSLSMDTDMFDVTCYRGKTKVGQCTLPYTRYIRDQILGLAKGNLIAKEYGT